jgi:ketosteroid isomerase-like protein
MKMFFIYVVLSFTLGFSLQAQNECPCCTEAHRQFDFWLGDWVVTDTLGNMLGENQIKNLEDGCILAEHWTGAKGGTGSSYNYFDKSDSSWNQLWVDNSGSILKLKGYFESGRMVLKSNLQKGNRAKCYYNQISWTPNEDGTVTQVWQIFNKDHSLLQTVFSGIYIRKKQPTDQKREEEVKSTLNLMWAAIENEDIELYASFIHPDFTQFGESDPTLLVGKEAEIAGIRAWLKSSSDIHTEMEEPRVVVKGNVAWISYYWKDRGFTNGKSFTSRGKSTRIFVKENGKWLCIHGHYTLLGNE